MDVINSLYANLFSIRLLHAGYGTPASNTLAKSIRVIPDQNTGKLFRNYDISVKVFNDLLVCFIRSRLFAPPDTALKVPFINFLEDIQIRLLLYINSDFIDKTAVVAAGKNQVYHFSNQIDNVIGSDSFLSRPVEIYDASFDYSEGTIVQDGPLLFQTLQPVLGSANVPLNDPAFWEEIEPVEQLVNNADLIAPDLLDLEEGCFGVIDIFSNGTTNNVYNLFVVGPDNQLRSPVYNIRFKSKI